MGAGVRGGPMARDRFCAGGMLTLRNRTQSKALTLLMEGKPSWCFRSR
jgi:3-hydroxyisobutyrate dehydrogenase-like beta-hydroxyacid dehydrogenase